MAAEDTPLLRPATHADVPVVAAIWEPGWAEAHAGRVPDALVAARPSEYFLHCTADRVADTAVAEIDGRVVGFVMVADDAVDHIFVHPGERGGGVAAALLTHAENRIAAAGHDRAWLAVVPGNDRAQAFYRRQGWRDEGVFDHAAKGPDGPIPTPCHRFVKPLR
ncbi:GNAT family N-acetyltransferase [Nocardioides sp. Soil796]|uniref:GNAT family N-acetyltransferase n=1 Tax=Nocardioides sp. Soil796 TaxID=1736412 RepID=UPI00070D07CA|nr:GNAT family N-acetyltransferase [Nocardioides sp. Soil796]KRF11913.1 GCN5 family acetyltransferase [Nocardioides sp. Soil796]